MGYPFHLSAERLEVCEQSRAEKSKVQIDLRVTSTQVASESTRDKGSLGDLRDEHTWKRAKSKGQTFGGRPMIGVREEEDLFGETEKEHLMRWVKQQGNVVLMKSREDNFR